MVCIAKFSVTKIELKGAVKPHHINKSCIYVHITSAKLTISFYKFKDLSCLLYSYSRDRIGTINLNLVQRLIVVL